MNKMNKLLNNFVNSISKDLIKKILENGDKVSDDIIKNLPVNIILSLGSFVILSLVSGIKNLDVK